jgi:hypothetical protein
MKSMLSKLPGWVAVGLIGIPCAQAVPVVINLGQSNENFVEYGLGPSVNPIYAGRAFYSFGQGTCSGVATTTCTLTGAITSGGPAGFAGGTYSFVTTYSGASTPKAGPNAPQGISTIADPSFFNYFAFDPLTNMTLTLTSGASTFTEALVTNGSFVAGTGFSFTYVDATTSCTGLPGGTACGTYNTGRNAGAVFTGRVTISATLDVPVTNSAPEPATLGLLGLALAGIGMRRRRATKA